MNSKIEKQDLLGCCFEEAATHKTLSSPRDFSVWIWNSVKRNLFLSESFCRMVSIPKGEIPTIELLLEYIYPKDVEKFVIVVEGMYKGILPPDFTLRVWLPDKSICTIQCIIGRMRTEWEGVYDIVGVCYKSH